MNSLCKQYISEVKLLLPAIGKSEKNYLASLTSNLEDLGASQSLCKPPN